MTDYIKAKTIISTYLNEMTKEQKAILLKRVLRTRKKGILFSLNGASYYIQRALVRDILKEHCEYD